MNFPIAILVVLLISLPPVSSEAALVQPAELVTFVWPTTSDSPWRASYDDDGVYKTERDSFNHALQTYYIARRGRLPSEFT